MIIPNLYKDNNKSFCFTQLLARLKTVVKVLFEPILHLHHRNLFPFQCYRFPPNLLFSTHLPLNPNILTIVLNLPYSLQKLFPIKIILQSHNILLIRRVLRIRMLPNFSDHSPIFQTHQAMPFSFLQHNHIAH